MRILLIHQVFVSPDDAGGTRHFEFARQAVKEGHEFTIVASDLSYLSGKRRAGPRRMISEENVEGIRVLRAFTMPTLHRSFTWRLISFFSFMFTSVIAALRAKKVDIIIGTSPPIFQAVSAWLVAKIRRVPFVLEIRDLWPDFAIDMGILRNRLLIWMSRCLEKFLYSQAHHIVVNSPAYKDHLTNRGISPKKVTLVPNGVDPDMFGEQISGESMREKLGLGRKFTVTYAGALGIANDIPTILRAAKRLEKREDITFLLVGDGKERSKLQDLAKELKLQNVSFLGARPKSEMPEILAASDVCVATLQNIPMFTMTYPNKVFDYMAAQKPIILGIDGVIRKVVEDANAGIFTRPGDDEDLSAAVAQMYERRAELDSIGAAGRRCVVEQFNRRKQAKDFLQVLEFTRKC